MYGQLKYAKTSQNMPVTLWGFKQNAKTHKILMFSKYNVYTMFDSPV